MTVWTALVSRELAERWPIAAAAAVAGVLPLLAPLLPGVSQSDPSELRLLAATIVATAFSCVVATMLGGTILGRDLASGRIAFYLARPVPIASLVSAKLLVALLMSLAVVTLGCLPSYLLDPLDPDWLAIWTQFLPAMALILSLLIVLSHLLHTFITARSPWSVLPILTTVGGLWLVGHLLSERPFVMRHLFPWSLAPILALLALLVATILTQVARARRDHSRGARVAARCATAAVVAVCGLVGGFLVWLTAVSPQQLDHVSRVRAVTDHSFLLQGHTRRCGVRFPSIYLVDARSSAWVRSYGCGSQVANPPGSLANRLVRSSRSIGVLDPETFEITPVLELDSER